MKNADRPKMTPAQAGRLGGLETWSRHGAAHLSAIGYAGALTTAERYYGGDMSQMMASLRARRTTEAVWDEKLMCWVKPAQALQ